MPAATTEIYHPRQYVVDGPLAEKIDVSVSNTTFVATAAPGSSQSNAVWSCKKIYTSGNITTVTWADYGRYTQIATDLTALTYA